MTNSKTWPIRDVRVSESAKNQLIRLKTKTGIQNWNVLCRWALCYSLKDPMPPVADEIKTDSNVEMTWQTFGGEFAEIYQALIKQRLLEDNLDLSDENIQRQFVAHLHRGIGVMFAG